MKSLSEIVRLNLISLRKQNKLTQLDLAKKISYSDKAISRWENGEVTPSLEILEQLAIVYNVPSNYFFTEHNDEEKKKTDAVTKNMYITIMLFGILAVWTIAGIIFLWIARKTDTYYPFVFIWAVPISILIIKEGIRMWFKNRLYILTNSIFIWSVILCIYFQFLKLNLWPIFLLGIPVQICIILIYMVRKIKSQNGNFKNILLKK